MLRLLAPPDGADVPVLVDGRPELAVPGESVAGLLLRLGLVPSRRTPVSGAPRAPYCLMGVCFDCLVEIDGRPNRQGCLVEVAPGMAIRRAVPA
jgi:D-hydroxyproline dehydrogenase subunit gamma